MQFIIKADNEALNFKNLTYANVYNFEGNYNDCSLKNLTINAEVLTIIIFYTHLTLLFAEQNQTE